MRKATRKARKTKVNNVAVGGVGPGPTPASALIGGVLPWFHPYQAHDPLEKKEGIGINLD